MNFRTVSRAGCALLLLLLASGVQGAETELAARCRTDSGFHPQGWILSGTVLSQGAVVHCRSAVAADPSNADLLAYLGRALYKNQLLAESVAPVAESARRGSALGMALQGILHEYGYGLKADPDEALRWYRRSAGAGHPLGKLKLAERLLATAATQAGQAQAFDAVNQAVATGNPEAWYLLGMAYHAGKVVGQDYAVAAKHYAKAADGGNLDAMVELGRMYQYGFGVPANPATAVELFSRASQRGHDIGSASLAYMYHAGIGVPRDIPHALSLYKRAAAQGNASAALNMAAIYRGGQGIAADPAQALHYYTLAAQQGQAYAQHMLGYMYASGDGVPVAVPESQRWYKLAAASYALAAKNGDVQAQYQLGMMYLDGNGVDANPAAALEWLQKAASTMPQSHLGIASAYQQAPVMNRALAARHLAMAAKLGVPDDALLGGMEAFVDSAASQGAQAGLSEVGALVRALVQRMTAAGKALTPPAFESVFAISWTSLLNSDYPLALFGLDALERTATLRGEFTDLMAIQYTASYVMALVGDHDAAIARFKKATAAFPTVKGQLNVNGESARRLLIASIVAFSVAGRYSDRVSDEILKQSLRHALALPIGMDTEMGKQVSARAQKLLTSTDEREIAATSRDLMSMMMKEKVVASSPGLLNNLQAAATLSSYAMDDTAGPSLADLMKLALKVQSEGTMEDIRLSVYTGLAKQLEKANDLPRAIYFGKLAVAAAETLRARFTPAESSLADKYVQERAETYRLTASLLAKAGRFQESEEVLRRLRKDEVNVVLRRSEDADAVAAMPRACVGPECKVFETQTALSKQYVQILRELEALGAKEVRSEQDEADIKRRQQRLEYSWEVAVASLAAAAPATSAAEADNLTRVRAHADTFASILSALGPGHVAVRFIVRPNSVLVIVSGRGVQRPPILRETPIDEITLNALIGSFREAVGTRSPGIIDPAQRLYELLLSRVDDIVEAYTGNSSTAVVMIAPDKALAMLPFAALHDGKQYVAEKWATTVFNDSVIHHLEKMPGPPKLRAFGVTAAWPHYDALPYAESELKGILGIVPGGPPLLNAEFTREKLRGTFEGNVRRPPETPMVHIASHFRLEPSGRSRVSALLLGDGQDLDLVEFKDWDLTNTELLTLSACETAVSPDADGLSKLDSISAIAQKNGAHAVLATLWSVNDMSTSRFMENFYRLKFAPGAAPVSKARALQETQKLFLSGAGAHARWKHPFYWAPFTLLGNWR